MQAIPSLAFGLPPGSCSGLISRATNDCFDVLSSFKGWGGPLRDLFAKAYFLNMAWLVIQSIIRLIKFSV
jgi:hypothetical protein